MNTAQLDKELCDLLNRACLPMADIVGVMQTRLWTLRYQHNIQVDSDLRKAREAHELAKAE